MSDQLFDICIVGSGAGAGPIAYELSKEGYTTLVLEKGPWFKTEDFTKDEITLKRSVYTPKLKDEPQVLETKNSDGEWTAESNAVSGRDFWNGNCVGGASNFMSGYFHRMKPTDFKLLSTYGKIEGANLVDWPITYDDLEPYYTKVEEIVGVSGKIVQHKHQDRRSKKDFPYPALYENVISEKIDDAAKKTGIDVIPIPRAILSRPKEARKSCTYSNYCGSYGCSTDAKGSSRAALLNGALKTGNCTILPNSKVFHLETNGKGKITAVHYYDKNNSKLIVRAKIFIVAASAIETSRLLLMSKNKEFPNGLSNNNGQVGKNLIFSAGGTGSGQFYFEDFSEKETQKLKAPGLFVNRSIFEWYEIEDPLFDGKIKGGSVDILWEHSNAISKAMRQKWSADGSLVFGSELKEKLLTYFTKQRRLKFEIFVDWLPTDNCFVTLDPKVMDKWGDPVARIRLGHHKHDIKVGKFIAEKTEKFFQEMGAKNIRSSISGSPPPNLAAGGCRFGNNRATSVLDKDCKSHEVENLYITDGSFIPTGGSITYTWTIYANAFRVADKIKKHLKTLLNN